VIPIRAIDKATRWVDGHSPTDVLKAFLEAEVELSDIVIVGKFFSENKGEDVYEVLSSSMPIHEVIGLLESGKHIVHERRKV
jgi:hypothetical protein